MISLRRLRPLSPFAARRPATLAVLALAFLNPGAQSAESKPQAKKQRATREVTSAPSSAFHPEIRTTASPTAGQSVPVNPPPLLWPAATLGDNRYAVRLSRAADFTPDATLQTDGLSWAMFNAHRPLEAGRWYWQYAIVKPGRPPAWSERHEFVVAASSHGFVTPPADAMLAAVPTGHPRILARPEELPALRQRAATQPDCQALIAAARRLVRASLPTPEQAKPAQKGATAFEEKNFAKWASKGFAGDFSRDVGVLAPAYLLTGDEAIGRAALARALFLAALDPDGDTSPQVSDFADGSCMRAMALAYDSAFALLTPAERDRLRQAMDVRAGRFFRKHIGRRFGNAPAIAYAATVTAGKEEALPPLLVWHRLRAPAASPVPVAAPAERPLSRAFRDVGLVAMHTDLADHRRNLFVAFNSCPFGAYGHMHPSQNAFNLILGGERLFASSGYYIAYGDAHFKGWYHHTRGHNTVLIDGQGQPSNSGSWGRIARHADNSAIAYSLGDASRAYGQTGLTRFRRHLALLRPATLVIYDELEAKHAAQWSWLLHSPVQIDSAPGGIRLRAATATGRGQVDVYGSIDLQVKISDQFDPPADNWRGKKSGRQVIQYPNQWHATVEPVRKTHRMRDATTGLHPVRRCSSPAPPSFAPLRRHPARDSCFDLSEKRGRSASPVRG